MSYPFLFLALSLASGIALSSLLPLPISLAFLILAVCILCSWIFFFFKKHTLTFLLILLSTVFLGSSLNLFHQKNFENNPLHTLEEDDYAEFYGTLYKSISRGQDSDYLYLRVEKVIRGNKEERMKGNMRVTVPHSKDFPEPLSLYTHDRVKVSARFLSSKGSRNFRLPSFSSLLKVRKIHKSAFTKSPLLVEKLDGGKNYSPLRFISFIRCALQKKIEEHFPSSQPHSISPQGAVLEALLLGESKRMPPSINKSLQNTGLYHLFAISGAHIAIISFLLFSVFKFLRFPSKLSYILLIVSLLLYTFLVEGRASVMRATIMALAFLLGKLTWRDVNLLNTISLAAFFLLLLNPFTLLDVGFQLTFAATYCIILFIPRLIKFFPSLPLRISEIAVLSITALLGVIPFMAYTFNRVTFSSLILNYAAIPLIGIIMACGFVFLPLSFIFPFLAHLLAKAIHFLIFFFTSSAHFFDSPSFLSYRIPTPHPLIIIGYFLFLFLTLLPPKMKKLKIIFLFCFLAFFALLITYPFPSSSRTLKCTFIDVGQGDSILIEFPGTKKMLIDGGGDPLESFDVGEHIVSPFLFRKGIKKINFLVLTHAHPDHLNGLKAVVRTFRISEYWEAFSPRRDESYRELKESLPTHIPQKRTFRGHFIQEGKVRVEILHPERGELFVNAVENNQSLVLRVDYGKTTFLLTADIEADAEKEILENGIEVRCQALKSPHHGSTSSSSQDFLDKASPRIVVISVGEGNRHGFPDIDVLERYKKIGAEVFRTDLQGAVEVSSDGKSLSVRTASKPKNIFSLK